MKTGLDKPHLPCGTVQARGGEPAARSPRPPGLRRRAAGAWETQGARGSWAGSPKERTTSAGQGTVAERRSDPLSARATPVLAPLRAFAGERGRTDAKGAAAGATSERRDRSRRRGSWGCTGRPGPRGPGRHSRPAVVSLPHGPTGAPRSATPERSTSAATTVAPGPGVPKQRTGNGRLRGGERRVPGKPETTTFRALRPPEQGYAGA